jgi:hypothetical protein
MSRRVRRANRRRRSRTPRAIRLLDRILAAPHLAHVVPRLQPEVLHNAQFQQVRQFMQVLPRLLRS